jgi:hypothetical protein
MKINKRTIFLMRYMSRRGLMSVAFLVMLAVAGTASAGPVTVPLSDFVIFSGGGSAAAGGNETSIGGHTFITGNIGSNQDLFQQGNPLTGYPAQLSGSAYAGGKLTFGQDLTVGGSLEPLRQVVANGAAAIGGGVKIWGTLDALSYTLGSGASVTGAVTAPSSTTFALITMPAATVFTAGGVSQTVPSGSGSSLTLAPGTYGTLATSAQNQTVILSSGNYYFNAITAQAGFKLQIDLTSGPVNIYVVGDATFAQRNTLMVKGAGTGGAFVPIDQAQSLAGLIYLETYGRFVMSGATDGAHNIWGGTVYASLLEGTSAEISIGQYMDWYGAAWAYDTFDTADHGKWTYVPQATVPIPAAAWLLGSGIVGLVALKRKYRP